MPDTMTQEEIAEAPAISSTPKPFNPAIDDSNIKAMAARFKAEYTPTPASAQDGPTALQQASTLRSDKPAQPAAPVAKPTEAPKPSEQTATPAPSTQDDPDIPPPDHAGPLSRQHWKKLHDSRNNIRGQFELTKKEKDDLAARAKQLEEDLAKARTAAPDPKSLEEMQKSADAFQRLTKEHQTLLEQMETINLERSPRFQNWWNEETSKHVKIAQRHVPADKREVLGKLLMEPSSAERDAAIDEIIEPLSNTSKRLISGAIEELEIVKIKREDALTKGSENYKKLVEAERLERIQTEQKTAQERERIAGLALNKAKQMSAFQPIQGDDAHNAEISQREAFVRAAVEGKLDTDVAVTIPAAAIEYLHLSQKVVPALNTKIATLEKTIRELQASSPSPSGGGAPAQKSEEPKEGTAFAAAVRKALGR